MATIVLQNVGAALGGAIGGPFGAAFGRALGGIAGHGIDQKLFGKDQFISGTRLENSRALTSNDGAVIPKVYGRVRIGGQLIWATRFNEVRNVQKQSSGKGSGPSTTTETFTYFGNFAVGICEGEISHIGRIWADGNELDRTQFDIRIYKGGQDQSPDPLIEAKQGASNRPAFNGTAYAVFDNFPLADFGNRIPQISFEVVRSLSSVDKDIKAVCIIPGSTEFGYSPSEIVSNFGRETISENRHTLVGLSDWQASLDELQALCPNLESVSLIVSWFGTDLRAELCKIEPRVVDKNSQRAAWQVSGIGRTQANKVSKNDGRSAFGGTPSDQSVIDAISDLKHRGLKILFYPFIMMDIPAGNALPDPYGGTSQPTYPWRGRITCDPAIGLPLTADKTATATTQIASLVGAASPTEFTRTTNTVIYSGAEQSYRRMILHYAHLCEIAGGVDRFLIGSEFRGLTQIRNNTDDFPFVDALVTLAIDVKSILSSSTQISYAADWSEYFGYQPQDGSFDLLYNLDKLWASNAIDAVAIDNYFPLSDWQENGDPELSDQHSIYDSKYLAANIQGGEGFDWYYASQQDRTDGVRTDITDGLDEPWVWRNKDIVSWWGNTHHHRIDGIKEPQATQWVPSSKPFWFTEAGCPAVNRGTNQPNVFFDPKSAESFLPFASTRARDDLIQLRYIKTMQSFWNDTENGLVPANLISQSDIYYWAWDARPFPNFPINREVWGDGDNWHTGHWLNGRIGSCPIDDLFTKIFSDFGEILSVSKCDGILEGFVISDAGSLRSAVDPLLRFFNLNIMESDGDFKLIGKEYADKVKILESDLLQEGEGTRLSKSRKSEISLPKEIIVNHSSLFSEFNTASTYSRRIQTNSDRQLPIDLPAILDNSLAMGTANARLRDIWASREGIQFALSAKYLSLSVGDVFDFPDTQQSYQIRNIEDGVERTIEAEAITYFEETRPNSKSISARKSKNLSAGPPLAVFMNLPRFKENDASGPAAFLAVDASPWQSEYVAYSSAGETDFTQRAVIAQQSNIFTLLENLQTGPIGRWDRNNKLYISAATNELTSAEKLSVLSGANALAIETQNGGWEILQFQSAELVSQDTYLLSGLLRGQLGTDFEMSFGSNAGATIVLLDSTITKIDMSEAEFKTEYNWQVGAVTTLLNGSNMNQQSFRCSGVNLRPLSPVHLRAKLLPNNDYNLSWIRRSRINADSWELETTPIGEESEAYKVKILDHNQQVKAELDTTSSSAIITHANLEEYGLSGAEDFSVSISQLSETGYQSPPATITISLN